jgi:uncharacterized membrane protein
MTDRQLKQRIYAVDFLRGIVMMVMLLDHTRDFVHSAAFGSDPTDPATTNVALFFTRWITHYCAPAFVFLSGVSIYLQKLRGKTNRELSWFLLTRGLWLIVVEFTIVRASFVFNFDYSFFGVAQVIWVIGVSMMIMAALVWLPMTVAAVYGLAIVTLHNLLDAYSLPPNITMAGQPPADGLQILWMVLHQQGVIPLFGGATTAFLAYPLIPWTGVMALGYVIGAVYSWDAERRQKWLLRTGAVVTAGFVILRIINIYGDPSRWQYQERGPVFTFLSFLNTTKYPPSLLFLLMTLGPAMMVLSLTDRIDGSAIWQRIAIIYGRVPMFYYMLQFALAHALAVLLSLAAGKSVAYMFMNFPANFAAAPPDAGFSLLLVYVTWIVGLAILFPLCLWYGNYKLTHRKWWLSYI